MDLTRAPIALAFSAATRLFVVLVASESNTPDTAASVADELAALAEPNVTTPESALTMLLPVLVLALSEALEATEDSTTSTWPVVSAVRAAERVTASATDAADSVETALRGAVALPVTTSASVLSSALPAALDTLALEDAALASTDSTAAVVLADSGMD